MSKRHRAEIRRRKSIRRRAREICRRPLPAAFIERLRMNVRGPGMEEAFAEFNDRILQEIATAVRLPVDLLTKPIPTDGGWGDDERAKSPDTFICPHCHQPWENCGGHEDE